jgi:putative peptidoglycan lipid II flippase
MTMLSRVVGFVRDLMIAQIFGVGPGVDAFFVAFKIPNFMRRLFAEGAFSQAFVPVLSEFQKTKSQGELRDFIAHITGNLLAVLMVLTILCVILSPLIVMIFAPGFPQSGERYLLASFMLKITFPYLVLVSMTALCGAVLNTFGRFGVPAFTPVLLNVAMILAAIYLSPYFHPPVIALAVGVLIGGVIQLLFQIPFLIKANLLCLPKMNWGDTGVKRVLLLMVPALFGVSVAQVNLLLDTVFASFLPVGSVSWLYYSDRLTFFPLGVFGVAIATVILPHLSRKHATKSIENYSASLDWGIRLVLLIALPSTVALILFSKPLLICLLGYGKFSAFDVLMTRKSLITFSLGLCAFMLIKILGSAFYATQNIKTPVKIGAFSMLVNTVFCLILIGPMAHAGLALASSIAGWVNAFLLLFLLIKRGTYQPNKGWVKYGLQLLGANGILALLLIYCQQLVIWGNLTLLKRIAYLSIDVMFAIVVYLVCLYVTGLRLKQFRQA